MFTNLNLKLCIALRASLRFPASSKVIAEDLNPQLPSLSLATHTVPLAMQENIPIQLGRQSSGEGFIVNLVALPNLFITHSNEGQLPELFSALLAGTYANDRGLQFALSLGSRMAATLQPLLPKENILLEFTHKGEEKSLIPTIDAFINALVQEFKRRKVLLRIEKTTAAGIAPVLVFIDDIFEVIMSLQKKTALLFIELLIMGAAVQLHFILGSSGIYRNLLNQITNMNLSLQRKLKKPVQALSYNQPLGAELVMNPDGLLFYRERDEKIHQRLYPGW